MKLYSIRDTKAEANLLPFSMRSRGEAVRAFGDACKKNDGSPLSVHPEDFVLFELGEFDEFRGVLTAHSAPISVCMGSDFLAPSENVQE